ncbi:MAG: MATE family efflux transporter [Inconstantimicrobium porci]|uniref:MATE family efflux transporter n=1 Tax=Inconstantimicrobium porci TaxID=2652291 RepID=UPI00240A6E4F|nr:MATE family efflux transporter [Inconstantimicrobium porci]MDD6769335.1 MATE family efflux transporter [Inconstantimicrobium porci]MDY5912877.1 MATE family efflux transporter [Inconstantimicrobium porci]
MTKKFLGYAIPSALAMFVSSLYTIIDGIFVGQGVGDSALAAVTIVMPLTIMLFGIAMMFAVGGGALVSKNFGAGEDEKGLNVFRQVFKFLLIISISISLVLALFADTIVINLGATESIKYLAGQYLRFYAIFCVPNLIGISLNSFVRNDNRPKLAMVSTITGSVTNIILDYVFIFPLGMGIKGAAIATGLGQIVTVLVVLPHFILKKGKLSFGNVSLDKELIRKFSNIGLPSFFAEAAFSVIVFVQNIAVVNIMGEAGLSAYSIINYITTNIYMVLLGVTFGAQPLISYNFGAKNVKNILDVYRISNIVSIIINIVFTDICFIFGRTLIGIFTSNAEILEIAYNGLNITNIGFFIVGLNLTTTVYYQAVEDPKYSNLLCVLRSVIFLPISVFVLVKLMGVNGVWISLLSSEFLSLIVVKFVADVKSYTKSNVAV